MKRQKISYKYQGCKSGLSALIWDLKCHYFWQKMEPLGVGPAASQVQWIDPKDCGKGVSADPICHSEVFVETQEFLRNSQNFLPVSAGFEYLYLLKADYEKLPPGSVEVHKIQQGGEERYVLDAIIGEGMKSTKCLGQTQIQKPKATSEQASQISKQTSKKTKQTPKNQSDSQTSQSCQNSEKTTSTAKAQPTFLAIWGAALAWRTSRAVAWLRVKPAGRTRTIELWNIQQAYLHWKNSGCWNFSWFMKEYGYKSG